MANTPQARKRARQSVSRRSLKAGQRSMLRTSVKAVLAAIESGDKEAATKAYQSAVPIIDRMADKDVIQKNKAARHKSRLNAAIKGMS